MDGVSCKRLMCRWLAWRVADEFSLVLEVAALHSTDMTGCIDVAKFLMPYVTRVTVCAGGIPDVVYTLVANDGEGEWKAFAVPYRGDRAE